MTTGETVSYTLHLDRDRKLDEERKGFEYMAMSIYKNAGSDVQRVQALGEITAEHIRTILEINK